MRNLLLASTSKIHGSPYLSYLEEEVRELFSGSASVLFVPYALQDRDAYVATVRERFSALGLSVQGLHEFSDPRQAVADASGIFVGGGNTFRLIKALQEQGLMAPIHQRVMAGMPYMGSSAGSNAACPTMMTTNDMPIVRPASFSALNLVPFQINPHYLDPDPQSRHMGESRETRIREYLEENETPVLGLREGALARVRGGRMVLAGLKGARLFRCGRDPEEFEPGACLDFLLDEA